MKKARLSIFNRDADAEIIKEDQDEMKTVIRCPYCGKPTTVGDTLMISGFVGCPNCYWDNEDGLMITVLKLQEENYEEYVKGDFYRNGYKNFRKERR